MSCISDPRLTSGDLHIAYARELAWQESVVAHVWRLRTALPGLILTSAWASLELSWRSDIGAHGIAGASLKVRLYPRTPPQGLLI